MKLTLETCGHVYSIDKPIDDATASDILWDIHNLMVSAGFRKETVQTAFEEILCELDPNLIISRNDIGT